MRFYITSVDLGSSYAWRFKIVDLVTGASAVSPDYVATFHNATRSWYLYETLNGNSQLGADDGAPHSLELSNLDYRASTTWFSYLPSNSHAIEAVANYRHSRSTAGDGSYWAWTIDN